MRGLGNRQCEAFFFYLFFGFEIFHFELNCTAFFHVKRRYWIKLMIEKKSLNFLTQFYSHLWLLQGYVYPILKNTNLWYWSAPKFKLGKFLTECFGETQKFAYFSRANFKSLLNYASRHLMCPIYAPCAPYFVICNAIYFYLSCWVSLLIMRSLSC